MHCIHRTGNVHVSELLMAVLGITAIQVSGARATPPGVPDPCTETVNSHQYLRESLGYIERGAEREAVLDGLECIAKGSGDYLGPAVFRAMFHIGGGDADVNRRLLRVAISPDESGRGPRLEASGLLSLGCDQSTRACLLEYVKEHWNTTEGADVAGALMDLGDAGYMEFLAEWTGALPEDDELRAYWEHKLHSMRLVEDPPALLRVLASPGDDVDRRWLLFQASRHGVKHEDLREAVVAFLRLPEQERIRRERIVARAGTELGIFTEADEKEFEVVRRMKRPIWTSAEDRTPAWATLAEKKRAEVYRLKDKEEKDD